MALWPFRRRSSRKRSRSGAALSDVEGTPLPHNEGTKAGLKKRRTEPPKPQQVTRKYSFSPGRQDDIRNERVRRGSPAPERTGRTMTTGNLEEHTGLWDRTPTLRPTRQATRKQRSKRRKEERNREAEIKAMSNFVPVRPATEQWNSGRPMKRDSKRSKTSRFGKQRAGRDSDISLPVPGSIHSSFSSDSELGSYRVSALAALAPRPTLRYTPNARWTAPHLPTPHRQGSLRKKLLEQESIPEENPRSHRRIDSFADDLDARDLRELMELDNRRREFKKQKERQRMERRIARRAEKQQEDDIQAREAGTPPPQERKKESMLS
ncbi:hypothetical protein QX201_008419 [Fusarium graminearum]